MASRAATFAFIAVCALASGGCAAGGLAAVGPVLSALQIVSDRTVERTVAADLGTTLAVTEQALGRMGVQIESRTPADDGWTLRGKSHDLSITGRIARATDRLTRVSLRVEAGRLTADKQTAEELQNQIARVLAEAVETTRASATVPSEALATLEAQVKSLRIELERSRVAPVAAPAPPEPRPGFVVDPSGVVSIPASYGFVTPFVAPAGPVTTTVVAPRAATPLESSGRQSLPDIRPTALEPAAPLTAVPAFGN